MAVPEQTPYIEHTGNGITTSFALGFQCETKDHLIVLVDDVEPPIATWSLTGGNVEFTTAPAVGKKITLQRNTPFSRTTDYQSYNNSFRPPAVNKDFDWIWWKLQELGVADWILGARIDALKNYVDRKDDELKAYLMEEIRKQGVALDQLEEYYNYLMERLAQIAVDKGWDSSFIVHKGQTQYEINEENISKNKEFVTVQDFMSMRDIEDSKQENPQYDHADSLIEFLNYIENNKVVLARMSGNFNSSKPLSLTTPKCDELYLNAKIKAISSGLDFFTVNSIKHTVLTGKCELTTGTTIFSEMKWKNGLVINDSNSAQFQTYFRTNGFKHWGIDIRNNGNSNSITLGVIKSQYNGSRLNRRALDVVKTNLMTTSELSYTTNIETEHYTYLAFIENGGKRYNVINHDIANKKITTELIPESATRIAIYGAFEYCEFNSRIDSGSNTDQRSNLILSKEIDFDPDFARSACVIVDTLIYRVMSYNAATKSISVFPILKDINKTSGTLAFLIGGGLRVNGSDANVINVHKFGGTGNAIACHMNNFYSLNFAGWNAENNGIAMLTGSSSTGITYGSTVNSPYFENNGYDIIDHSTENSQINLKSCVALNWEKVYKLTPQTASGAKDTTYSKTGITIEEGGKTWTKQDNIFSGVTGTTKTLTLGEQEHVVIRATSPTIILKDDAKKRELFGYVDLFFSCMGIRNNSSSSDKIILRSADGYTINGVAGDFIINKPRASVMFHARLIGNNWQVNQYKAEMPITTKSIDLPSIAAKEAHIMTTSVSNAEMGDFVSLSFDIDTQGLIILASVVAATDPETQVVTNMIKISFFNPTTTAINLPPAVVKIKLS